MMDVADVVHEESEGEGAGVFIITLTKLADLSNIVIVGRDLALLEPLVN